MRLLERILRLPSRAEPLPADATPYQRAQYEWDDRYGRQAKSIAGWKAAAFVLLLINGLVTASLFWLAQQSKVVPYVIEVDGSSEAPEEEERLSEPGRPREALGSGFPESPALPPVRYAAEAPRAPQPSPGKTRFEQALAAPPLVAPAGSPQHQEAEPDAADPTSRLVQWMERRMPADSGAFGASNASGTPSAPLRPESSAAASPQVVRPASAVSPYVLYEGTILPAVLTSELTSDLPGIVTATLRSPVFDSPSGHHLILPAGTKALGRYDTSLASGDSRLLVSWHRLILPDGRFFEILLSILSAGAQLAQPDTYSNTNRPPTAGEIAAGGVGQQVTHLSTNLLQKDLDVKPTLTIRPGTVFGIVLQADIAFAAAYSPSRSETLP